MTTQQPRIVVLGAGYAGLLATIRLAGKTRRHSPQMLLINASDVFVERLRLHQVAANQTFKPRYISDALRGTGVKFRQGIVTSIDTAQREIIVQTEAGEQRFEYDYLLYTLGSLTERDSVPGVRDYAYTLTPTGPLSVAELKEKLPGINAAKGHVVICGGGATGVESAAEFASIYPDLKIRLVTRGTFGEFLGTAVADYMRQSLERLGVVIQDQTVVARVGADEVVTSTGDSLPCDLCLWTGGFTVPTVAHDSGITVNERGQILIDPFMRSISHPEIFAAGDASYPVEKPGVPAVRMSAFTAVVTGAHAADCLSMVVKGKTLKPLSFAYAGQGIALGRHNAIGFSNAPLDIPHAPYFKGRLGYSIRETFVKFLAAVPMLEKRWPGFFFWIGKGRYTAMHETRNYRTTQQEPAAR